MLAGPLVKTALVGLVAGLTVLVVGLLLPGRTAWDGTGWAAAHGALLTFAFLLPAFWAMHLHALEEIFDASHDDATVRLGAFGILAATGAITVGELLGEGVPRTVLIIAGMAGLTGVAWIAARQVWSLIPRGSVVDVERDPLTKGDDACLKHLRFAHAFLVAGFGLLLVGSIPLGAAVTSVGWTAAGTHVLLVGYGLLSIYGLGHLWVPRFSGVPAIAAGAIKGELHATLLGVVGLAAGFLSGVSGFLVGLGPFVFLGFFTYMGVLGANIMRRKSATQRVTPEFVYIPWTFSGIFWLIGGVLMGVLMGAFRGGDAPDLVVDLLPGLAWVHVHVTLLGGMTQLFMGWLTRSATGATPPPFRGAMKASFYLLNLGLIAAAVGRFGDSAASPWMWAGLALVTSSFILFWRSMGAFMRPTPPAHES